MRPPLEYYGLQSRLESPSNNPLVWKTKHEMGLIAMIAYVGDCEVTDERDCVYSLLGIVRDSDLVGHIDPSDSVARVFAKLVRSFISRYDILDIICFAHLFNAFDPRSGIGAALPS